MLFAQVIVDITNEQVDKPYTYIIPEHLNKVLFLGMGVNFPFGKGNHIKKGYVIKITDTCDYPIDKLKTITGIEEKSTSVESNLIDLAIWMSKEYGSTFIQSLKTVLPVKEKIQKRKRKDSDEIEKELEINSSIPTLNYYQQKVYDAIAYDIDNNTRKDYLINGVTGSGKTLVYMELMKKIVSSNKQGIVLIPEIALTTQTIERFRKYFGDKVGFIHSRLSNGERYEIFNNAKEGKLQVVIGPRSALFMPFKNLGMIIIDEEHETSYKSEKTPCYHAREVALYRAKKENASVVLGSGTPSVTSYYYATHKDCIHPLTLLELPYRAGSGTMPDVKIVDMRNELKSGNKEILSTALDEAIKEALSKKEQVMLFLNRRGYAGFVSCRHCGYTVKCNHCDVSMSYHKGDVMKCHYCGSTKPKPSVCPECGSRHISTFKIGTEQLEEYLINKYEGVKVLRMDADTTKNKQGHAKILEAFRKKEADILIGTQMIVKGHDFEDVTVVGAVAADMSLNASDYMSGERTFDLLSQAAGRTGRGCKPGKMFIQTYNPDNYAIVAAANLNYKEFYNQEILYRSLLGYPPASHILKILLTCKNEEKLELAMEFFNEQVKRFESKYKYGVIGPTEPYAKKMKDTYRKVLYVKSNNYDILIRLKDYLEKYFELNTGFKDMFLQFDFDPMGD